LRDGKIEGSSGKLRKYEEVMGKLSETLGLSRKIMENMANFWENQGV